MSVRWAASCVVGLVSWVAFASPLEESPDWFREGDAIGVGLGQLLAVGDVDGDGYDDLVASSAVEHVVFAGTAMGPQNSVAATIPHDLPATSIALCDVDGDGYLDLVSGEGPFSGTIVTFTVRLYFGGPGGLFPTLGWESAVTLEAFPGAGPDVACAGDLDGNGIDDLLVGMSHASPNGLIHAGEVALYLGRSWGLSPVPDQVIAGVQAGAFFGRRVAVVGDVDGDGRDDVVIGAPGYDNGETNEGRAYLYRGRALGLSPLASRTWESNQANAAFGLEVAGGDVNGDGFADVVIAAPGYSGGLPSEGRVSAWHGSSTGLVTTPAWIAEGNNQDAVYGLALVLGDRDGDGTDDLAVGGPLGYGGKGVIDVFLGGGAGLSPYPAESTIGVGFSANPEAVGYDLASGDVDGDGLEDLAACALFYEYDAVGQGAAMVWRGNPDVVLPGSLSAPEGGPGQFWATSLGAPVEYDESEASLSSSGCATAPAPSWVGWLVLLVLRRRRG